MNNEGNEKMNESLYHMLSFGYILFISFIPYSITSLLPGLHRRQKQE